MFRHINGKFLIIPSQIYTKFWASSDVLFFSLYLRTIQKNRNIIKNKSLFVSENMCCFSVKNRILKWSRYGQIPPLRFRDLFNDTVPSAKISYVFFPTTISIGKVSLTSMLIISFKKNGRSTRMSAL
jgi:hypothetical protein